MNIKIDTTRKAPVMGRRGVQPKYPFDKLEVGHSFIYPTGTREQTARSTASTFGTRHKKKFTVSKVNGVLSCWRVK